MISVLEDTRPIVTLEFVNLRSIFVGDDNVEKIEVYSENGQGALVPWFYITKKSGHDVRVNGAFVAAVIYGSCTGEYSKEEDIPF